MTEPNIILASEAARHFECAPQTIYNALARGDLNEVRMGRHRFVVKDAKFDAFTVKDTGGRMHLDKREDNDTD